MSAIRLHDVTKAWGTARAVDGVSFEAAAGGFAVLLGPSGCGKSTTLRLIAGLETVSAGRVLIGGTDVTELPPARRGIAMVFQSYALFPHLSVAENILFGLKVRGVPATERGERLRSTADLLGLSALLERKPSQLSGGQQQRVALGRAIIARAPVCLMDEPLSNLDAQLRHEMRSEIKRLHQRLGATIIYVTHDQVEAMTMADRIAVLSAGRLMQYDTPDAIYNRPAALFVAGFTGAPPMNLIDVTLIDGQADLQGLRLPLPRDLAARAPAAPLKLGVRPENLRLARASEHDLALPAEVVLLEPLGAETLVTLKVGGSELIARLAADFRQPAGSSATLHLHPQHLHLFNAETGSAV